MKQDTNAVVLDALRRVYRYRQQNKVGGLSNAFPIHLLENIDKFDNLIESLSDEISRDLVKWFIKFRIINSFLMGKEKTKSCLDPLICQAHETSLRAAADAHRAAALESSLAVDIIENWLLEGYSLPGICEPESGDIVLDCGAFNGNSSLYFAEHVGDRGRVLAIEPDPSTLADLKTNVERFRDAGKRVEIHNFAVAATPGELRFSRHGAASRVDKNGDIVVSSKPIDAIVAELALPNVDLIKLDVEGYEKQALRGAAQTIKKFRPKLMVCIYHLAEDIIQIPKIISEISPWYRLYARHHASHDGELVLYCQPIVHHRLG